jgi:hypothetical protein
VTRIRSNPNKSTASSGEAKSSAIVYRSTTETQPTRSRHVEGFNNPAGPQMLLVAATEPPVL